jgi:predicted dehydrogenase
MKNTNRRSFLKNSVATLAGTGLYSPVAHSLYSCAKAPSDRLNIAAIGLGFGTTNMRFLMEADQSVHCAAMCDVEQTRLEERSKQINDRFPDRCKNMKLHTDFRKVLDDKDIDGVIIATPDHWHGYMFAEACKAGKAIYIEKPTGRTIGECDMMVEMQKKYKNVVTTGLWHISLEYFIEAFDILKTGILGEVYKVHAWIYGGTDPVIYDDTPQQVPDTLDYKMWLGPAPIRPYLKERVLGQWRHYWDYGGGRQTDWVHYLDSALDGIAVLGHEQTYPKSVHSVGYKHPETMREVPSTQTSVFQFEDIHIVWEHASYRMYGRRDGVAWIGSDATLVCNRTGYDLIPNKGREDDEESSVEPIRKDGSYGNQFNHMVNWADCIRNNNPKTNSPVEKGSYASVLANMANISHRMGGQSIEYMPDEQKFRNNPEADAYIFPEFENNWTFPAI